MRIILAGPKGIGKSTLGRKIAGYLGLPFYDMDSEIAQYIGQDKIVDLKEAEYLILKKLLVNEVFLISTAWHTVFNRECMSLLTFGQIIVLLKGPESILVGRDRNAAGGKSEFGVEGYTISEIADKVYSTVEPVADLVFEITPYRKSGVHRIIGDRIRTISQKTEQN